MHITATERASMMRPAITIAAVALAAGCTATVAPHSHHAAAPKATVKATATRHHTATHHHVATRPPVKTHAPVKPSHRSAPTHKPSPTHARVTHTAPPPSPASVVESYFAAINRRDYATAYQIEAPVVGGTAAEFAAGFTGTARDAATIDSVNGNTVTVSLTAYQTDGSVKRYHGVYTVSGSRIVAAHVTELAPPAPAMTIAEQNAIRAAHNYLSFSAFSRAGLIQQLASPDGDGYGTAVATFAVDHITVDWNAQAVKSAKNYLSMEPFSRAGLIEQLSSSAGEGFTLAQATYAADQVGLTN